MTISFSSIAAGDEVVDEFVAKNLVLEAAQDALIFAMKKLSDAGEADQIMANSLNRVLFLDGDERMSAEDLRRIREARIENFSLPPCREIVRPLRLMPRHSKHVLRTTEKCKFSPVLVLDVAQSERLWRIAPCSIRREFRGRPATVVLATLPVRFSRGFLSIDGLMCGNSILAGLRTPTNKRLSAHSLFIVIPISSIATRRFAALGLSGLAPFFWRETSISPAPFRR